MLETLPLQWGRAQMSAEMKRSSENNMPCDCLQWGRAQMSAEMTLDDGVATQIGTPSMGPRSDERGKVVAKAELTTRQRPSIGPRSDERGNAGGSGGSCLL